MMKKVYLNPKQIAFIKAKQKVKTFIGSRGAGKSTVGGVEDNMNVQAMPRGKGFVLSLTYKQALDFVIPSAIDIWSLMGYKENIHYVINKKPPKGWPTPYQPVRDYSTCISWINGTVQQLISFDRKDNSRGGNFDFGRIDEASLFNQERVYKEIIPSLRGNIYRFNTHRHHSISFTTSMPWDPSGMWVPDMQEQALLYPDDVFYIEATAQDNIHVLGEDYLKNAEKNTPYLVFQVEYLNQRIGKMPNAFYDQFDTNKHCYVALAYEDHEDWRQTKVISSDYDENRTIDISFDFGGNFNCMIAAQDYIKEKNEVKILKNFYVKNERKLIDNLVNDFCSYYQSHKKKHVVIYGDRNGNSRLPNSELTLYQQIQKVLRSRGWESTLTVKGLDALHNLKHIQINRILEEHEISIPKIRINKLNCKELIISIQAAGITNEFKKDKRSERHNIPQEKATHLSDAFDNYVVPKLGNHATTSGAAPTEVFFGR
jgi:hypothetical protein